MLPAATSSSSKTALVIQHLAFEDLGTFAHVLHDAGYQIHYRQAGVDELGDSVSSADLVIVLGGPIGAYETDAYPFLVSELAALKQRLVQSLPTLGICLGAQLIAEALGGRVYSGGRKEIGWSSLTLSEAGCNSPLSVLKDTPVLHWHGDTFDLPPGAELLASSSVYPHQAFRIGSQVLALQFHPEVITAQFERWLIGHAAELGAAKINPVDLRHDARQYGALVEQACVTLMQDWLQGLQ